MVAMELNIYVFWLSTLFKYPANGVGLSPWKGVCRPDGDSQAAMDGAKRPWKGGSPAPLFATGVLCISRLRFYKATI